MVKYILKTKFIPSFNWDSGQIKQALINGGLNFSDTEDVTIEAPHIISMTRDNALSQNAIDQIKTLINSYFTNLVTYDVEP